MHLEGIEPPILAAYVSKTYVSTVAPQVLIINMCAEGESRTRMLLLTKALRASAYTIPPLWHLWRCGIANSSPSNLL